jgi:hypothetical protein
MVGRDGPRQLLGLRRRGRKRSASVSAFDANRPRRPPARIGNGAGMSDERDETTRDRDDDELGGGGPTDLATGGELSETPGGSGPDVGGGTGAGGDTGAGAGGGTGGTGGLGSSGVGGGDPGGGGDASGDDTLDEAEETDRPGAG